MFLSGLKLTGWPKDFSSAHDRRKASEIILDIQETKVALINALRPAPPELALTAIEALQTRYYQASPHADTDKAQAIEEMLTEEWLEDLSEYPIDLIKKACANWRRADNRFAPASAGVLMDSVKPEFSQRKANLRKADTVINLIGAA